MVDVAAGVYASERGICVKIRMRGGCGGHVRRCTTLNRPLFRRAPNWNPLNNNFLGVMPLKLKDCVIIMFSYHNLGVLCFNFWEDLINVGLKVGPIWLGKWRDASWKLAASRFGKKYYSGCYFLGVISKTIHRLTCQKWKRIWQIKIQTTISSIVTKTERLLDKGFFSVKLRVFTLRSMEVYLGGCTL